ncbi:unnamed protein product, partial [Ectocarpus fasciculatus]
EEEDRRWRWPKRLLRNDEEGGKGGRCHNNNIQRRDCWTTRQSIINRTQQPLAGTRGVRVPAPFKNGAAEVSLKEAWASVASSMTYRSCCGDLDIHTFPAARGWGGEKR